ncbi:Helicase, C-terminal:Type III restriction enzyme, res subunit:DEAD/DEAH box helicase, N-terminal [Citrifermentans bremense]|uniref:Helicase, C-terminal:Type III restriction enzyme, res subunit:DEAD/DEAH box helicase, N-terminal n=1 Tax=Citrifermentans bremense TaxID=60035 RepID=A0A6S6M2L4_9BACT|nr:DEAD/DEAH box helicase [Citrifermentans bremense]BCG47908.1 Helicase, C-terminal:Type III restriction enzyme, res subunit:DEAD/DEAH box helicase, N-terminal [Citrifermentans bremense]
MLPSLVVEEVRRGVAETLRAQFEPSTELFKDAVRRLIETPPWVQGPYVQLGLPFVEGSSGKNYFADFQTEFPAHRHQELAWQLCGKLGRSTLVATGTGSGKTECFLYPVLDHVAKARKAGVKGIKAIIIYPMNALADDQAGRIAELVHKTPAFAGIRAGLFVGSGKGKWKPGKNGQQPEQDFEVMGPDHVITDKDVQRHNPPDILLTNYKMLDFLMIRPGDQGVWKYNSPDTLRYLVVDELHTFDGAQGTDLAMLIRRLRRRLGCEDGGLVCVGTSATLGDAGDTLPLREYAGQVFAAQFDADAVVTESRKGFDDFIGDAVIEHLLADDQTVLDAIARQNFTSPQEAVRTYLPAFFPHSETLATLVDGTDTVAGRIRLGEELKKHLLFQTLLRTAAQSAVTVEAITDRMQRTLSAKLREHAPDILSALLTLVAWARAPHSGQKIEEGTKVGNLNSLVSLRLQIWLQELRRIVSTVSADASDIELASEASVLSQQERLRLPIVQCRQCRTTGWLTLKAPQESRVQSSLEKIYAGFFSRNPDTFLARLYPRLGNGHRLMAQVQEKYLCCKCGHLASQPVQQCSHCQSENLLPVHLLNQTRTKNISHAGEGKTERHEIVVHDDVCPVCGEQGEQLIIGAQTTSIAAHAVERLWSAPLNQHKKLILFSDSVQDAAHRAGYIESKTESHLMRAGIARGLAIQPATQPWSLALDTLGRCYLDEASPLYQAPEGFVAQFIAPTMEWLRDWKELTASGRLPEGSDLPQLISQRMQWRAIEELTHRSDIGRTLSKMGVAVLFPDVGGVGQLCEGLTSQLQSLNGGLERINEGKVFHWALGTVLILIRAGAVFHMGLERVAETGDFSAFEFAPQRKKWILHRGKGRPPRFVAREVGRHRFLDLQERDGNQLLSWARLALGLEIYSPGILTLACEELLGVLEKAGIGHYVRMEGRFGTDSVFGLNPECLMLCQDLQRLVTPSGSQSLWVPKEFVEAVVGLPAWNSPAECLQVDAAGGASWWRERLLGGEVHRVIAHEHTGLLERDERVELQNRFMAKPEESEPWFENLLSATPTLEMGINIGALSSVMLGGVPPNQASFIQRIGRAGRLDGNAAVFTIADASPDGHDQYFFSNPLEMLQGAVEAPAIYLGAAEVLRRQIYAFFFDHWVAEESPTMPDKLSEALDQVAVGESEPRQFPFNYLDFVNRKEPELFDAFCRMLGENLTEVTREKLESFVAGNEQQKNLRTRFLAFFEEMLAERESWKARRKRLNAELGRLRKQPQDEQVQKEIEILEKERAALGQRIQQLNSEHLLEAMTNAGLLPNYAFPEEGVSLTTIIHGTRSAGGEEYSMPLHRYSRPAHAALAEFAPRNTFFAHKSKVEVDQIDMSVEPSVAYRFCARCNHLAPLSDPMAHAAACPKCNDALWEEQSQSRPMLRLRRAVANIDRADKTRITEQDEARSPRFYMRRLLMNFDPEDVRTAWALESDVALYGFEYLSKAQFHDLNLGQPAASNGQGIYIAGDDSPKTGFSLCSGCGKVQPAARPNDNGERTQVHTPDCRYRNATDTEHLLDELFLFREFESECLRILVPKGFGSGDQTTYSFMSALQLGLRKRFGGKVDHLRFEVMHEAGNEDAAGKTYILIYDSVPGGTGYLQQMLSGEADTLIEVLTAAYKIIRDCSCQTRPDLDGCYQCVFHYRQGRHRRNISRMTALEMLQELVEGNFTRKKVAGLSEIYINPDFGSELERRFLPALKALGGQLNPNNERFPAVQISQDIKAGKTAYLLMVGKNRYWVDTQVPVEDLVTGQELCRPDFVISATKTASPMRPIAVFVDGWEWHGKIMSDDARKRSSLMLQGKYRVWSATYEDIEAALKHKGGTDLDSPLSFLMTSSGQAIPQDRLPNIPAGTLPFNAIAWLLWLLGQTDPEDYDPLASIGPVGQHLLCRSVRRSAEVSTDIEARCTKVMTVLPAWLVDPSHQVHLQSPGREGAMGKAPLQWVGKAEPKYLTGASNSSFPLAGGLVIDDSIVDTNAKAARSAWRQWLRVSNLLQGTPGVAMLTDSMLAAGHALSVPAPTSEEATSVDATWSRLLDGGEFVERLKNGFAQLAGLDVPPPIIGVEIEEGDDYRIAEAVWESAKVVLLTVAQADCTESWQTAGYAVIEENETWWKIVAETIKERVS